MRAHKNGRPPFYAPLRATSPGTPCQNLAFRGRPRRVLQSVNALINARGQFGHRHLQPASQSPQHAHGRLLLATLHQGDERPVKVSLTFQASERTHPHLPPPVSRPRSACSFPTFISRPVHRSDSRMPSFECPSRLAHQRRMASTRSRPALTSAFTRRDSSRSISQCPPVQALRDALALPSGVLGPVACFHGFQVRISSACLRLRSGVQLDVVSLVVRERNLPPAGHVGPVLPIFIKEHEPPGREVQQDVSG